MFPYLRAGADLLLQRCGVVRNSPLQRGRQIEHQRHRQQDRHGTGGDPDLTLAAPKSAHPLSYPLAGEGEEQQRQRGSECECRGEHDGSQPDGGSSPGHDDRS